MLAVGGIYGYRYVQTKLHPADFSGNGHGTVLVHVPIGATATSLAPELLHDGVVASISAFISAAKASTSTRELEPGTFQLHKGMNAARAYNLLIGSSARIQTKVLIPEGLRKAQIIDVLAKQTGHPLSQYSEALRGPSRLGLPSYARGNPEGYLFPDTYEIQPGTTPTQVLQLMVHQFNIEAQSVNLAAAARAGQLTESHVIIAASLIQAEGGRISDFPKIAEVIYNRLNRGMKLQLDSTVFYAMRKFGIQATDQDLKTNSPYNTYLHAGLPPTPIDSPGLAAIKAALHPAHGHYLYFVTVDPKKKITKFTASPTVFSQFQAELAANLAKGR